MLYHRSDIVLLVTIRNKRRFPCSECSWSTIEMSNSNRKTAKNMTVKNHRKYKPNRQGHVVNGGIRMLLMICHVPFIPKNEQGLARTPAVGQNSYNIV